MREQANVRAVVLEDSRKPPYEKPRRYVESRRYEEVTCLLVREGGEGGQ